MERSFTAEGLLFDRHGTGPGWVRAEEGRIVSMGRGRCPFDADASGFILTDILNMHTHCADYGLRIPSGMSLEDLVAPPDGLKHRYLRTAPESEIRGSMIRFSEDSRAFGSASFVDFREGGVEGCRMLREAAPKAVILGRPVSPEFDPEEIARILGYADGIGIPSISDMDIGYIESVADAVRDARRIFALHVSERVREDIDLVLSLDPAFVVHMCEATDDDICKCAEAEVPIVVCPTSNAYFGKRCPAARVLANGADMALGTDNGMIRSPDAVDEAAVLAGLLQEEDDPLVSAMKSLTAASGKILNAVRVNRSTALRGPVTVIPSPEPEAGVERSRIAERAVLNWKENEDYGIQEHTCAH